MPDYRKGLLKFQSEIDQQIAEAEALMLLPATDAMMVQNANTLAELRETREDAEGKLRAEWEPYGRSEN